ncbi:glycine--tRNA ligase [Candidatus Pacearchaeota archaeon]|nr:glycine--tRNA ligase [Candidatus Pacearchaeota archaeon]
MAYVVKQNVNGGDYYYLRKSVREGGKVVSKSIAYLGKTKTEADKKAKEIIKNMGNLDVAKSESKAVKKLVCEPTNISIEELANFCKSKGFVFRSSDIYGGLSGFWDFGPLGVELFKNLKDDWWNHFVYQNTNMVGMEASIISHPRTWKASGHIENFNDLAVVCKKCKKGTKIDVSEEGKVKCECGGEFEVKGKFSLMFKTNVGALNSEVAYLRGETAQGMFMNFKLIHQTSRMQLPFGVAQIGRCFRNEIAPRDFLFRCREFHIGEFEFFIHPEEKKCELLDDKHLKVKFRILDAETQVAGKDGLKEVAMKELVAKNKLDEWHAYWLAEQIFWFRSLGLDKIKIREHTKEELSHYSSATFDIDYEYPFGSKEVAGNANRGQYDLMQHQKESKQSMEVFDEKTKQKVLPRVIEPTFGMERVFLAILTNAYCDDKSRGNIVLRIPAKLAPIKVAVFPLIKQKEFEDLAKGVSKNLGEEFNVCYDKSGSVGRRYARNDEIGTPFCVTIDGDSVKNNDVTIRDRDTTKQIRVKISDLKEILRKLINSEIEFEKAGKLIN